MSACSLLPKPASSGDSCRELQRSESPSQLHVTTEGCLPPEFPSDIPLIEGPVLSATVTEAYGAKSYAAVIGAGDPAAAESAVRKAMTARGYGEPTALGPTTLKFDSARYVIIVSFLGGQGPSQSSVSYGVSAN